MTENAGKSLSVCSIIETKKVLMQRPDHLSHLSLQLVGYSVLLSATFRLSMFTASENTNSFVSFYVLTGGMHSTHTVFSQGQAG